MIVALILATLALSAFFSGSEMAYIAANRLRVEMRAREHGFIGKIASGFIGNPASMLTTTLVGNNLALVVYSTAAAWYLEPPLEHFFQTTLGFEQATPILVLVAQTTIASLVVLIFGEIIPKSIIREMANRAVFYLALPLLACAGLNGLSSAAGECVCEALDGFAAGEALATNHDCL